MEHAEAAERRSRQYEMVMTSKKQQETYSQ
jgi:hypothetical protein